MIDTNIYNDPNVLVGDSNESSYYKISILKSFTNTTLPWRKPPEEGFELFKKWVISSHEGKKWADELRYLASLKIDDYIWMYSQFPNPFLKSTICKNDKAQYNLYKELHYYYIGSSPWLYWLSHKDKQKPLELEEPAYLQFELSSHISNSRLNISQQIIDSPEFSYGGLFYRNPAFLWFLWETAICREELETRGILTPITLDKIQTKREFYKEEGLLLEVLEDTASANKMGFKSAWENGFSGFFNNLPGIIDWISAEIASKDTTYRDTYHAPYLKLQRIRRNAAKNSPEFQLSYRYQSNNANEPQMFTTGNKRKLPQSKRTR